jgi:hypothetical protein
VTIRTAAVIGLAAVASLAGCGAGSDAPSSSDSARPNPRDAFLEVARCMRAHGYPNFPDPVQDEQGRWMFPDTAPQTPRQPPACTQLARRAKSLLGGPKRPKLSAAEMTKLRSFARCMRQQGLSDWPDPDAKGAFQLPTRLLPPNGPRLAAPYERACKQYMPSNGIQVANPSGTHDRKQGG